MESLFKNWGFKLVFMYIYIYIYTFWMVDHISRIDDMVATKQVKKESYLQRQHGCLFP